MNAAKACMLLCLSLQARAGACICGRKQCWDSNDLKQPESLLEAGLGVRRMLEGHLWNGASPSTFDGSQSSQHGKELLDQALSARQGAGDSLCKLYTPLVQGRQRPQELQSLRSAPCCNRASTFLPGKLPGGLLRSLTRQADAEQTCMRTSDALLAPLLSSSPARDKCSRFS